MAAATTEAAGFDTLTELDGISDDRGRSTAEAPASATALTAGATATPG